MLQIVLPFLHPDWVLPLRQKTMVSYQHCQTSCLRYFQLQTKFLHNLDIFLLQGIRVKHDNSHQVQLSLPFHAIEIIWWNQIAKYPIYRWHIEKYYTSKYHQQIKVPEYKREHWIRQRWSARSYCLRKLHLSLRYVWFFQHLKFFGNFS